MALFAGDDDQAARVAAARHEEHAEERLPHRGDPQERERGRLPDALCALLLYCQQSLVTKIICQVVFVWMSSVKLCSDFAQLETDDVPLL